MNDFDYYRLDEYLATLPPAQQPQKKTFWETGFGSGLSNIWSWATSNPQQVVNLVAPKKAIDPTSANYLQNGGYVGGQTPTPQQPDNNNNSNNNTLLIIMGVVIVVILFFMFKNGD